MHASQSGDRLFFNIERTIEERTRRDILCVGYEHNGARLMPDMKPVKDIREERYGGLQDVWHLEGLWHRKKRVLDGGQGESIKIEYDGGKGFLMEVIEGSISPAVHKP